MIQNYKIRQGREHVSYIEGDYAVRISRNVLKSHDPHIVEYDFGPVKNWHPPHENELITQNKKKEIMSRVENEIRIELNQRGYEYEIKQVDDRIMATQKPINRGKIAEENKKNLNEIRRKLP